MTISVLIVDDDPLVRSALGLMLGGQPWTREQTRTFVLAAWDYAGF